MFYYDAGFSNCAGFKSYFYRRHYKKYFRYLFLWLMSKSRKKKHTKIIEKKNLRYQKYNERKYLNLAKLNFFVIF